MGEELVALWAQMLDTDSITSDTDFFRNGGDSLQILELLTAVEQPWDVDVPVEDSH
ncbi:acyl carrier protein [Streptomyces tauricus]|uniref:acyl carrier protein n=1 Tax=Streptomyces tauricus TaxID=68274 RepID=UPI0016780DD9|nr:acyl carrier protein [Streptomyces tauricus]